MQLRSSTGQMYPLQPGNTTLGQSAQNDIVVNNPALLPTHVDITQHEHGIYITPRGPGVTINREPLTQARYITPQDVIQIGPYTFQLVPPGAPPPLPPQSARYDAPPSQYPAARPPEPFGATAAAGMPPSMLKNVIAAGLVVIGVLVMLGFFVLPWVKFNEDRALEAMRETIESSELGQDMSSSELDDAIDQMQAGGSLLGDLEDCSGSAVRVAIDQDFCATGDLATDTPSSVRNIQYLLFLIPLLAMGLVALGIVLFMTSRINSMVLALAALTLLVLIIFPFIWTSLYNNELEDFTTDSYLASFGYNSMSDLSTDDRNVVQLQIDLAVDIIDSSYRTTWLLIMGIVGLLISAGGLVLAYTSKPAQSPYSPPAYGGGYR